MMLPSRNTLMPNSRMTSTPMADDSSCRRSDSELAKNAGNGIANRRMKSGIFSRPKTCAPTSDNTRP